MVFVLGGAQSSYTPGFNLLTTPFKIIPDKKIVNVPITTIIFVWKGLLKKARSSGIIAGKVIDDAITNKKFKSKYLENKYCLELEKSGLFSLRDVDFVEKYLSNSNDSERYVKRIKALLNR